MNAFMPVTIVHSYFRISLNRNARSFKPHLVADQSGCEPVNSENVVLKGEMLGPLSRLRLYHALSSLSAVPSMHVINFIDALHT